MEIWDKMFNFQDNTGLLYSKWSSQKKQPLFVKEYFKSNHQEWSDGTKCWILKIAWINRISIQWKCRPKLQSKYWSGAGSISGVDFPPHNKQRWVIDGTSAIASVNPKFRSKEQPKYGSGAGSGSRVEPPPWPQSPKVRHRWDQSQSGP